MTQNKDRNAQIRARMAETGEPYTEAARQLSRRPADPSGPGARGCASPRQGPPPTCGGMLLWINGPSGGGMTATAYELNRRLSGSVVCGMRRMPPAALRSNWWDLPALRHSVGYFQEVVGGLAAMAWRCTTLPC